MSTPVTTPNTELAYRALDTARAHDALDMDVWAVSKTRLVSLADLTTDRECGTTACLAGWVAALAGYQVHVSGDVFDSAGRCVGHIEHVATELLGISIEQGDNLFYVDDDQIEDAVAEIFGPRPAGGVL